MTDETTTRKTAKKATTKKDMPIKQADFRDEHTLRLVSLRHSGSRKEVWFNVALLKALRETTVDPLIVIPDEAVVAETFVTVHGESAGMKVEGRPIDVLNKIRDHSIYI